MKKLRIVLVVIFLSGLFSCNNKQSLQSSGNDTLLLSDTIQYHPVRINKADGSILPWFSPDPGKSYDTVVPLTLT